jgi:hypothetical protein
VRLVIIEHPLAGRHGATCTCVRCKADVTKNLAYARACIKDCLKRGEAPFASAPLYAHPEVYDDSIPEEREAGIAAGLAWGDKADATVVYNDLGISGGMQRGIGRAIAAGRPIEHRTLGNWR